MGSLIELLLKPMMNNKESLLEVAQLGRLVGLKGELKLHLHCDFPEQFKRGKIFFTPKNETLEVLSYNQTRGLISFVGYADRQSAQKLVNTLLLTTKENSVRDCSLKKGEFFWFELIGAKVIDDNGISLGIVKEIERIALSDYLVIQTDEKLSKQGHVAQFYLPYIERYILSFDKDKQEIYSKDGLGILENS